MTPRDMKVLVIGDRVWGKGDTVDAALLAAGHPKEYMIYVAHPDTYVDKMGNFVMPSPADSPKRVHVVGSQLRKRMKEAEKPAPESVTVQLHNILNRTTGDVFILNVLGDKIPPDCVDLDARCPETETDGAVTYYCQRMGGHRGPCQFTTGGAPVK